MDFSNTGPRGLLVNNNSNFVCNAPNFSKLQQATQATLNLPYDDQGIPYVVGFTDKGMQELYADILIPTMDDFYKSGYFSVGDVCKLILELSAAAQGDYDEIFDALERLYGDESGDDSLREEIQAKMKERIDKFTSLSNMATDVINSLRDGIRNVTEAQILGESDSEDFDIDWNALGILQDIIDKQNMQDDSGCSINNLQHAVGAAVDIWNDLTALSTYVAENTDPGPGPLLNLHKNKLLEMWSDLATEAKEFLHNYMG
ncbi:hypothetical protein V8C34DRAFT_317325 [Trichoderma compactum]